VYLGNGGEDQQAFASVGSEIVSEVAELAYQPLCVGDRAIAVDALFGGVEDEAGEGLVGQAGVPASGVRRSPSCIPYECRHDWASQRVKKVLDDGISSLVT
jgi:hypothetical protein